MVYANYGTPEDFEKLEKLKIDVRGKIVLVRYGQNFRGVKEFIAQEHGAAGVIIYSDPYDDGWRVAINILPGHGGRIPACSAGRWDTCSSFPAIRPRRELHRCHRCRRASGFLQINLRRCRKFHHAAFLSRCVAYFFNTWPGQTRRANGRARCLSRITWARSGYA